MLGRNIEVKRWRATASSYVLLFVLSLVSLGISYLVETIVPRVIYGLLGMLVLLATLRKVYLARSRTTLIAELVSRGKRSEATVIGFKSARRYDADMSFMSLLDGGSGISFSKYTIFIVKTTSGKVFESDLANVPEKVAERYVAEKAPITVYARGRDCYVDVRTLSEFRLKDLMPSRGKDLQ